MTAHSESHHDRFMQRAFELARRGVGHVSPNPPVGAVAVREGEIIAEGWHRSFGGPHGEADLIATGQDLSGSTIYVSLEPCAHHGKTPPCSQALIGTGCRQVFFSVEDPNPETCGRGPSELVEAGVEVVGGLCEDEGRWLLAPYLKHTRSGRPLVTCKWAMTLDGKIATETGDSRWISSSDTLEHTRAQRREYDAILVGRGTVVQDDPELTSRTEDGDPLRVVLDSQLETHCKHRLVQTLNKAPLLIVTTEAASARKRADLEAAGVEVVSLDPAPGGVGLPALLDHLGARGVAHLLVEGGAEVHGSFLDLDLVDRVQVIVASKLVGGRGPGPVGGLGIPEMAAARCLTAMEVLSLGDDLVVSGALTAAGLGQDLDDEGTSQ